MFMMIHEERFSDSARLSPTEKTVEGSLPLWGLKLI